MAVESTRSELEGAKWYVDDDGKLHQASYRGWTNEPVAASLEPADQPLPGDIAVLTKLSKDFESKEKFLTFAAFEVTKQHEGTTWVRDFQNGQVRRFRSAQCRYYRRPLSIERRDPPKPDDDPYDDIVCRRASTADYTQLTTRSSSSARRK
jgi:hypothetical protein